MTDTQLPRRLPLGRRRRRPPDRGRQRQQRHLVPRARDADGLPGAVRQGLQQLRAWREDLDLVAEHGPERLPLLGRVGARRARRGRVLRRGARPLRGDRRRVPRARARADGDLQPLHRRRTGSPSAAAGSTPRRPRCSRATATASWSGSATGSRYAVTINEPNLTRLLSWLDLPDFVRELERATLEAASEAAGVERTALANVMLPEEFDAFADGMTAGHRRARRPRSRPAAPTCRSACRSRSWTTSSVGDDPSVRDRKRAEVYERWLELARDDDFVGVQNYERIPYDGAGPVPPRRRAPSQPDGHRRSSRCRWAARSATRTRPPACRSSSPSTA